MQVLSVIVPLYNEELVIDEMHNRLSSILNSNSIEYEIIMVNDGSTDGTKEKALTILETMLSGGRTEDEE